MLHPKNCKKCGGKLKMAQFGDVGNQLKPNEPAPTQLSSGAPVNPIATNPIMQMQVDTQGTANSFKPKPIVQTGTNDNGSPKWEIQSQDKNKWDPFFLLRGMTTGLAWLANKVERGRQDQYEYQQRAMLAQQNAMPASDYQPNPINPGSAYAKYGGQLNHLTNTQHTFSNKAMMDMTDNMYPELLGMQMGGNLTSNYTPPPQGINTYPQGYKINYPGDTLTPNQIRSGRFQYQKNLPYHGYPSANNPLPLIAGEKEGKPIYYMPSQTDYSKLTKGFQGDILEEFLVDSGFLPMTEHLPAPMTFTKGENKPIPPARSSSTYVKKPMKKGGNWLKGAVNPEHKGWCTPLSNPHCTGHRRAFALMMKKKHGFHK